MYDYVEETEIEQGMGMGMGMEGVNNCIQRYPWRFALYFYIFTALSPNDPRS